MKSGTMRRLGVVLVVAAALGTAGGALACDGSGSAKMEANRTLASSHKGGPLMVVSSYLGLTRAQILSQLKAGKTLAQIANATPGRSATGLVDAIVAAVKTKLDARAKAGKLAPTQETTILAAVRAEVTRLVNRTWNFDRERHDKHHG